MFKQHRTGFVTERPLELLSAVEKYIDTEDDVRARWTYKVDDDGSICESEITTFFNTTTEVTLSIMIITGVFEVHGPNCRKFVSTEFDKIKTHTFHLHRM